MAYEILGYDYSAMAASAPALRSKLLAFGLGWCALALAACAWSARRGGWAGPKRALANFGVFGVSQALARLGGGLVGAGAVWWCWEARAWTLPDAWWSWGLCFLGVDYGFYWWHRLRHASALWWSTHESHHSSPELSLSTAFRITDTMDWFGAFVLYCPLALMGMHPAAIAACGFAGRVWQIWTHANGWLGPSWADKVLVTDAVHRLHHAKNVDYLDRNFGDVLSVWDRLHGTWADPSAPGPEPEFGSLEGDPGHNPLWIASRGFARLGQSVAAQPGLWPKAKAAFLPPGWSHAEGWRWTARGIREALARGELAMDARRVPLLPSGTPPFSDAEPSGDALPSGAGALAAREPS